MTTHPRNVAAILQKIYEQLYNSFGPQHWWPGETPFEVAVGAILTQNTNWGNVEKAIENLKARKALSPGAIHGMSEERLAELIRPAGYFNVKARRLKAFMDFLMKHYRGSLRRMKGKETSRLREELLSVNGIGPETADSILLYALERPVFVIDAYTKRVLSRHGIMDYGESYGRFQELFRGARPPADARISDVEFYNEYHALFVRVGKTFCKGRPLCGSCPLKGI